MNPPRLLAHVYSMVRPHFYNVACWPNGNLVVFSYPSGPELEVWDTSTFKRVCTSSELPFPNPREHGRHSIILLQTMSPNLLLVSCGTGGNDSVYLFDMTDLTLKWHYKNLKYYVQEDSFPRCSNHFTNLATTDDGYIAAFAQDHFYFFHKDSSTLLNYVEMQLIIPRLAVGLSHGTFAFCETGIREVHLHTEAYLYVWHYLHGFVRKIKISSGDTIPFWSADRLYRLDERKVILSMNMSDFEYCTSQQYVIDTNTGNRIQLEFVDSIDFRNISVMPDNSIAVAHPDTRLTQCYTASGLHATGDGAGRLYGPHIVPLKNFRLARFVWGSGDCGIFQLQNLRQLRAARRQALEFLNKRLPSDVVNLIDKFFGGEMLYGS